MNPVTVALGVAALLYGLYTAWARQAKPHQFHKIEAMKKMWGERGGLVVHFLGYTALPIAAGIALIVNGLRGVSVF